MDIALLELTLRVALLATLINVPLAVLAGWLVARRRVRGSLLIDIAVSLPLAVPPVVVGFLLLLLLGREGPLGSVIHGVLGADVVFTWVAAVLAAAVVSLPLVARATITAMGEVDERLEMSARTLGAGPLRVLFTVTVPLAYRGILAGVALGFVRALSEFGATITVAGNIPGRTQTLPLAIYSSVQVRDDATATNACRGLRRRWPSPRSWSTTGFCRGRGRAYGMRRASEDTGGARDEGQATLRFDHSQEARQLRAALLGEHSGGESRRCSARRAAVRPPFSTAWRVLPGPTMAISRYWARPSTPRRRECGLHRRGGEWGTCSRTRHSFPHMSVGDNIRYGHRLRHGRPGEPCPWRGSSACCS